MKQPIERGLAAILAADVAGYSRLMGLDEEGTHERLRARIGQLVDPKIKGHRGRTVKNTGDGILAEFASVVDAVRCAVEVQRGMAASNADVPTERRIEFRIGINLGDVIVEAGDIFGDGSERRGAPRGAGRARRDLRQPRRAGPIVVLPFANLSNDSEHGYLADGITEDLTTDLSRIEDMFVISRSTAFTYRNKPVDTRQIGRELNVRYVLEGSIRPSGNRIRFNAQLIDAETDAHIWAERFDLHADDLLWLQDEVTARIAIALNVELVQAEAVRHMTNPDALDYVLRGRAVYNRASTRENLAQTIGLYESALVLDPACAQVKALLAGTLTGRVLDQLTHTPEVDLERAETLIAEVLAASPRDPMAHFAKAQVLRAQSRFDEAIPEYETAVALNRNWVIAIAALGQCKLLAGAIDEAIPTQEQAIRLSPRDPHIPNWYWRIGMVHLLKSRTGKAIEWLQKAQRVNPLLPGPRAWLAAAYALAGDTERAAAELAAARRLGDDRYSSISRFKRAVAYGDRTQALAETTFLTGLRKAGVPEE